MKLSLGFILAFLAFCACVHIQYCEASKDERPLKMSKDNMDPLLLILRIKESVLKIWKKGGGFFDAWRDLGMMNQEWVHRLGLAMLFGEPKHTPLILQHLNATLLGMYSSRMKMENEYVKFCGDLTNIYHDMGKLLPQMIAAFPVDDFCDPYDLFLSFFGVEHVMDHGWYSVPFYPVMHKMIAEQFDSYDEAKQACMKEGGDIASRGLRNRKIHRHIAKSILTRQKSVWIGLTQPKNGKMSWSDGTKFNKCSFWNGEKMGKAASGRKCAVMSKDGQAAWEKRGCYGANHYVLCEKPSPDVLYLFEEIREGLHHHMFTYR